MKVAIVGSGGREHALACALARSCDVVVTPGNPGMQGPSLSTTAAPPEEIDADLVVIGPEVPLVEGLADRLRGLGKRVLGPGADGARLEGSKAWMKDVVAAAGIPTARHAVFTEASAAAEYLKEHPGPFVIKTDGLAAGKGVLVTDSLADAMADVEDKLAGRSFGSAGSTVVIEEHMDGPELSVLAVCDGRHAVALDPAQDFKRVADGDRGPNTGGMGAYSPVPIAGGEVVATVMDRCIEPLVAELRRRGIDYRGVLYAGLMLTSEGPKIVEYNVRFGDPETQAVVTRYAGDFAELLTQAADGHLRCEPSFSGQSCATVVLAAEGYPGPPRKGDKIQGVQDAAALPGVSIFHAGTARDGSGELVTNGGRVVNVTGLGDDLATARARAYGAAERISFAGMHYRRDIARAASGPAPSDHDPTGKGAA